MPERTCKICGATFPGRNSRSVYCSDECRREYQQIRNRARYSDIEKTCVICDIKFTTRKPYHVTCGEPDCVAANSRRHRQQYQQDRLMQTVIAVAARGESGEQKSCEHCGETITGRHDKRAIYCSDNCRYAAHRKRKNERNQQAGD